MKTREQILERLRMLQENPWYQATGSGMYAAKHVRLAMEHEIETLKWVLGEGVENRGVVEAGLFNKAMLTELNRPENLSKGGWKGCKADWLYSRALDEMYEVEIALRDLEEYDAGQSRPELRMTREELAADLLSECADVANFLMMIADVEKALK